MTQISPADLEVGCSYLEVHPKSYTLFTVLRRIYTAPDDVDFTVDDYYYSSGQQLTDPATFSIHDFTSPLYLLTSALTNDELLTLYPEFLI